MNNRFYRHGDLFLRRIDEIPQTAKKVETTILAEGETTGHKHRLVGQVQVFEDQENKYFTAKQKTQLVHEEHKTIEIEEGNYAVVQEREWDPITEARRVAD